MPSQHSSQAGVALPPMKCNEFIEHVLENHKAPTTIIICSSREDFLDKLYHSLQPQNAYQDFDPTKEAGDEKLHPLLVPTIHRLSTARTVNLAFVPSLPHLRAYLASFTPSRDAMQGSSSLAKPGLQTSMLAIYGLVSLHRDTTEYAVQGLSRSMANAVETAEAWGMRLTLVEDSEDWVTPMAELVSDGEAVALGTFWTEQIPLLNSSIALSDDRIWAGRKVDLKAVIARWCLIGRL
ncbi:MAG: hypothetical protein Q9220_002814 [cf. Caloplaca sp. 1 TL-2023]